jgi:hypothetical protein
MQFGLLFSNAETFGRNGVGSFLLSHRLRTGYEYAPTKGNGGNAGPASTSSRRVMCVENAFRFAGPALYSPERKNRRRYMPGRGGEELRKAFLFIDRPDRCFADRKARM